MTYIVFKWIWTCLQCCDAVVWMAGRASGLVVRYWHEASVWSEMQMICIRSSWCHCHPIISCFSKIQNGLPFWCRLTQVVLEKRPLNGCSVIVVKWIWMLGALQLVHGVVSYFDCKKVNSVLVILDTSAWYDVVWVGGSVCASQVPAGHYEDDLLCQCWPATDCSYVVQRVKVITLPHCYWE